MGESLLGQQGPMDSRQRTIIWSLTAVIAFVGVGLILMALFTIRAANAARAWPSTEGTVLSWQEASTTAHRAPTQQSGQEQPVQITIRYEYSVDGETYQHDRIAFALGMPDLPAHDEGDAITVYYDPDLPSEAVLLPGESGSTGITIWIGAGACAIAMVLAVMTTLRTPPRSERGSVEEV